LMCATLAKLNKLILWYFKKLNIKPVTIHHKWLYSRWGYCQVSSRKIFISSLLCSFNIEVIKYVIVHEICHLIHPNHSKKFWNTVSTLFPDYKLIRKNMKGNGVLIK
jgi:predicted metal-dependent hydrolase